MGGAATVGASGEGAWAPPMAMDWGRRGFTVLRSGAGIAMVAAMASLVAERATGGAVAGRWAKAGPWACGRRDGCGACSGAATETSRFPQC